MSQRLRSFKSCLRSCFVFTCENRNSPCLVCRCPCARVLVRACLRRLFGTLDSARRHRHICEKGGGRFHRPSGICAHILLRGCLFFFWIVFESSTTSPSQVPLWLFGPILAAKPSPSRWIRNERSHAAFGTPRSGIPSRRELASSRRSWRDARGRMCSSRKILWSLLLLSLVEVGLGVASIVLGAVGIIWVRGEHPPQQGDASPVWSGLCVRELLPSLFSVVYFQSG